MKKVKYILLFIVLFMIIGCNEKKQEEKPNMYSVVFVDEIGEVLFIDQVEEGKDATPPEDPVKEGYIFIGWDTEYTNITSNITIGPEFEKEIITYTVQFIDNYDVVLKTQEVFPGHNASSPITDKDIVWSDTFTNITEDKIIRGTYVEDLTEFSVSFYDDENKIDLNLTKYNSDEVTKLPTYTKEGYEFIGWFLSDISLYRYNEIEKGTKGDITFYARFIETTPKNIITLPVSSFKFTGIKTVPVSGGNGVTVSQPVFPSGVSTQVTAYDWTTSDKKVATISAYSSISSLSAGYCIITATLKSDTSITGNCIIKVGSNGVSIATEDEANEIELCTVKFTDKENNIIYEQKVIKGHNIICPIPKIYEGYKFVGWDKENYNITSDCTINPIYEVGENKYTGKKIAIIGDSISTYLEYVPSGYACFYPYPTADVNDVNQTWWMNMINKLGAGLFVNNSYSGSCVSVGTYGTAEDRRLKELVISNQTPDVIIIYMGSNDAASANIALNQFDSKYDEMLTKIKKLCPNSEILLCTLPTSNLYSNENKIEFNNVITKYSQSYDYKIIDLSSADITGYLVDSAHPKKAGMDIVSNKMISELLK